MSDVFEVPLDHFDPNSSVVDDPSSGEWHLPRSTLPEGILPFLDGGEWLVVKLYLEHPTITDTEEGVYDPQAPFQATLHVYGDWDGEIPLVFARRNLSVAHLWTGKQRDAGFSVPGFHSLVGDTHAEVTAFLVKTLLESVLVKTPKLTIRWDERGIVVLVNFANTYISTREHQMAALDVLFP